MSTENVSSSKDEDKEFVDRICKDIISKFKLDPASDGSGIKDPYDDLEEQRYEKVIKDHCVLLRKLIQFAKDINVDTTINHEKKLQILQCVTMKIYKIDRTFNTAGM